MRQDRKAIKKNSWSLIKRNTRALNSTVIIIIYHFYYWYIHWWWNRLRYIVGDSLTDLKLIKEISKLRCNVSCALGTPYGTTSLMLCYVCTKVHGNMMLFEINLLHKLLRLPFDFLYVTNKTDVSLSLQAC